MEYGAGIVWHEQRCTQYSQTTWMYASAFFNNTANVTEQDVSFYSSNYSCPSVSVFDSYSYTLSSKNSRVIYQQSCGYSFSPCKTVGVGVGSILVDNGEGHEWTIDGKRDCEYTRSGNNMFYWVYHNIIHFIFLSLKLHTISRSKLLLILVQHHINRYTNTHDIQSQLPHILHSLAIHSVHWKWESDLHLCEYEYRKVILLASHKCQSLQH